MGSALPARRVRAASRVGFLRPHENELFRL